ncbi:gliding motility-associated C-terminal domain-containing protein [Lutibacter oricola]|uniref:Gliding motility-associated C-terminal domain-containing protein n=1 Tax=Lutibacter oricola TaxID=762486 RepID=A0A1H2RHT4_9FLAO|nr:T9SS type B sorting domain-containing protein [Lutibacter oricola]SDW18798.1 gliding motility-associated C-terminal domain-containing protein [Lutibacter oricola]
MSFKFKLQFLVAIHLFFYTFIYSNQPPVLTASGNQVYCPQTQMNIVTDFNITDPDDNETEAIFIQISTGYINGEDTLTLQGTHPNISTAWNALEGKLTLKSSTTGDVLYTDLINAVKNVVFESSSPNPSADKSFSITIGDANYLPSTDHYYEYVPSLGITWTNAKAEAETRTYFGLKGYLATITSAEEAQLSGEQAAGAGWIGGTDEETEGVWKWATGPETGTVFWNGGVGGSTPNFAFWNTDEPNQQGNEDYTHVTAPGIGINGSWNDLSNTGQTSGDYQPKGYIVEYGGTTGDPVLNISASTTLLMNDVLSTSENNTCDSGIISLSATAKYGDIAWFDSLTNPIPIYTGTNFNTPNLTATTTYYVVASINGCLNGTRTAITATVYSTPTITSTTDTIICESGTGVLNAVSSSGTINWYDANIGGNLVGNGNTFNTPNLTTTTNYFVEATENGCTTTSRTQVTATVQNTTAPTGNASQSFCDIENATIANLTTTGTAILWYSSQTSNTPLNSTDVLVNGTTYYATQTVNTCESTNRLAVNVTIFNTVNTLANSQIPILQTCDNNTDGDDTNGYSEFDLTLNENTLLNGESISEFEIHYYSDASYSPTSEITNITTFTNTVANSQTIFVRIENKLDTTCYSDTSFTIEVTPLPSIINAAALKNCDEDGIPDGFTNYNLNEATPLITNGDTNLSVSYYLTVLDAQQNNNAINPVPFNNSATITPNTVYARIENSFGCFRTATITLQVSTTSFPAGYSHAPLEACDNDDINDGIASFDLTQVSNDFINLFPSTGQTLSVHYYRNLTDAELEQNEILPQNDYRNETPNSQSLFVRVESELNEECFGIGEYLTLNVQSRPNFEVEPAQILCKNLLPKTLTTFNADGNYHYQWFTNGVQIGTGKFQEIYEGGEYTVTATSSAGCISFEKTIEVTESNIASITLDDILTIEDTTNSISIATENLGIGNYEFSLDNINGPYQSEPIFNNVAPGIRTIFIKDQNNCGIEAIDVSIIGYPKFFTPNNDGYNDTWKIIGATSEFYRSSTVQIFDRFGKLITQFNTLNESGWDGTYIKQNLPSSDYWFKATLINHEGAIIEKIGHFSLLKR